MITSKTLIQDLFKEAINRLSDLQSGEEFVLNDLFKGYQWNRIDKRNRIKLGGMFLAYVNNNNNIVKVLNKNAQNKQKYKKV